MKGKELKALTNKVTAEQLIQLYELLPDILFWIKDIESKLLYANSAYLEQFDLDKKQRYVGKTDHDFIPSYLAQQFINDDQKVMSGELVTNRMELNMTNGGVIAWFVTSKRPLVDEDGEIIGTYGISRHLEKTSKELSHIEELSIPIDFIKDNYTSEISIANLAELSHLSVSALERRFKKHLKTTPKQFINNFRLEQARKLLLETNAPIAQVAYQIGFSEPSYFTKLFKKQFGLLPSDHREMYQREHNTLAD